MHQEVPEVAIHTVATGLVVVVAAAAAVVVADVAVVVDVVVDVAVVDDVAAVVAAAVAVVVADGEDGDGDGIEGVIGSTFENKRKQIFFLTEPSSPTQLFIFYFQKFAIKIQGLLLKIALLFSTYGSTSREP